MVKIKIIDSHMHLFTKDIFLHRKKLKQNLNPKLLSVDEERLRKFREKKNLRLPQEGVEKTAERWLFEFSRCGIEKGIFFGFYENCRDLIDFVAQNPKRFLGYTSLNPTERDAPKALKRDIKNGLCGVKLYPGGEYFRVCDEKAYPFYEMAQKLKIPIAIHFGLSLNYYVDHRYTNPLDLDPVARDFPDLKFIIAHFGCGFMRETLFLSYHCDNVYFDTSGSNSWVSYLPYKISLRQVFKKFLEVCGVEKILFGTDSSYFPRGYRIDILKTQLKILKSLKVRRRDVEKIFYENILRILER
ncbi:MAG: amidohydrolase family protein [Candidatus Methanofastidiosia archaeon]